MALPEKTAQIIDFTDFRKKRTQAAPPVNPVAAALNNFLPDSPTPGYVWYPVWVLIPEGSVPQP